MNNNNNPMPASNTLKKLRTTLAILQGTRLLSTLAREAEATVSHDQTKRVTYLTMLFTRIHRDIFHDWRDQVTASHRPGVIVSASNRKQFRNTIGQLVLDGQKNQETAIFDNNGFVIYTDNIADRLACFYQKMRTVRPFSYGNRITLDIFMTTLGHLPAFKAVYEAGIDFRRLAEGDASLLHALDSSHEQVTQAMEHALDPTRNKSLKNRANSYGTWPENKYFLSGIPFLSHTTEDGRLCLVTVNGGLVPVDTITEDPFTEGKHLADSPLSIAENIIGYLPGTEYLRQPGKRLIDGIPIREDGVAPLFCLDVNMLTGLRTPSHMEFLDLLKECEGDKRHLFKVANNDPLKQRLLAAADGDKRLERTVEIAYDRLCKIQRILINTRQKIFEGKTPVLKPRLFMSMGGAGAGKTAVEEIAQAECEDNFVIASLDEFRKLSDLYNVLTAANHHSDDYVYVEPFANRLRDMVAQHAKEAGINILYDGTGIPYQPRYSTIIEQFKAAGFHTQITAVDAFLVKPMGREQELSRCCVIESVKERFKRTSRALPWVITIDKHIRAPRSFLTAVEDANLDKITLFANDGEMNKHYLVAESFALSEREVTALQRHQQQATLRPFLKTIIIEHPDSFLKNLAGYDQNKLQSLIKRNPAFTENNVAYQIYSNPFGVRGLLIYNTQRWIDFIQKRQLNPNASGEEGLLHKSDSLIFHVDPLADKPWITRLQGE